MVAENIFSRTIELAKLALDSSRLGKSENEYVAQIAKAHIKERLGRLRGLPQKVGQLVTMAQGDNEDASFDMTASFEPLPVSIIQQELQKAWQRNPDEILQDIDPIGYAASLGQVHKARLKTGQIVAVKVRYPGIRQAVMHDLKLLGWLSIPVGNLKKGFNIKEYQAVILEDLDKELNYLLEAKTQEVYSQSAKHIPGLVIPKVYSEFTRESVLVTSWEEGLSVQEASQKFSEDERRSLSNLVLQHFCQMFFFKKKIHADPNPGNYRFRVQDGQPQVVLLDFGCVYKASNQEELYLLRIIDSLMCKKDEDPYPLFLALGFNQEFLEPIREKLPALCRVIFEPFIMDYPYDLKQAKRPQRVSDILGQHRLNFRLAGPAKLIFLMRAFAGLEYYIEKFGVDIIWKRAVAEPIQYCQMDIDNLHLPIAQGQSVHFSGMADHLYVEVKKNGVVKAELVFPLASVDDLVGIMDPDIVEKSRQRGINIDEVSKKARQNGYRPQDLFTLHDGPTHIRVWLQ